MLPCDDGLWVVAHGVNVAIVRWHISCNSWRRRWRASWVDDRIRWCQTPNDSVRNAWEGSGNRFGKML